MEEWEAKVKQIFYLQDLTKVGVPPGGPKMCGIVW